MITTQQITQYYDLYRNTEVAFTKDVIRTLGVDPRQIYVKCTEGQWPCIINSTSFSSARIIIGTKSDAYEPLSQKDVSGVSIRLNIRIQDNQTANFFITCKVTSVEPYMNSADLTVVNLSFTQRPPDDLIEAIGHLLDANINAIRRKDERIPITPDSRRKLGLPKDECIIIVQNVPRHCILRDISFSGAKVAILGIAHFLLNKEIQLDLEFEEPHEVIQLRGTIESTANVEGRRDVVVAGIKFTERLVPLAYKLHISNYLTNIKKGELSSVDSSSS